MLLERLRTSADVLEAIDFGLGPGKLWLTLAFTCTMADIIFRNGTVVDGNVRDPTPH